MTSNSLRRFSAAAACGLILVACGKDPAVAPLTDEIVDVFTPGAVFSPTSAELGAGGTVRFHIVRAPDGDGHNALFNHNVPGAPDDINIVVDTTVSRIFRTRGTFAYLCTVHPGMGGEVIVH